MRTLLQALLLISIVAFVGWWVIPNFVLGRDMLTNWPWFLLGLVALAIPINYWIIRIIIKRN